MVNLKIKDALLKRSNTAGAVPATGDMKVAELAINTVDNFLFVRTDNGIVLLNPVHVYNSGYSINTTNGVRLSTNTNFVSGSTQLYVNGLRKKLGLDYEESASNELRILDSSLASAITIGDYPIVIDFIKHVGGTV